LWWRLPGRCDASRAFFLALFLGPFFVEKESARVPDGFGRKKYDAINVRPTDETAVAAVVVNTDDEETPSTTMIAPHSSSRTRRHQAGLLQA
jgi:hypothetical protein